MYSKRLKFMVEQELLLLIQFAECYLEINARGKTKGTCAET